MYTGKYRLTSQAHAQIHAYTLMHSVKPAPMHYLGYHCITLPYVCLMENSHMQIGSQCFLCSSFQHCELTRSCKFSFCIFTFFFFPLSFLSKEGVRLYVYFFAKTSMTQNIFRPFSRRFQSFKSILQVNLHTISPAVVMLQVIIFIYNSTTTFSQDP